MENDIYNNSLSKIALAPVALSSDTTTQGLIIDTQGMESGKIILSTGIVTTGDITIEEINESDADDMTDETVIPDIRLRGTITVLDGTNESNEIGFWCTKRYVRLEVTTDNSAALLVSASIELGHPAAASVREYS